MPDLMSCVVPFFFEIADAAANTGAAIAIAPAGLPDTAEVAAIYMPKAGAVVGLIAQSAPAGADTQTLGVYKNGTLMAGSTLTNTNAAPNQSSILSKDTAAFQFVAGDLLSVRYQTSAAAAVKDIYATLLVQFGLSE